MADQNISRALNLGLLLGTLEIRYSYSIDFDDDQADIVQMHSMAKSLLHTLNLSEYANRDRLDSDIWQSLQSELWSKYGEKVRIALQVGIRVPSICMLNPIDYPKASQLLDEIKEGFVKIGLPVEEYDRLISEFSTKTMSSALRIAKFQTVIDNYFEIDRVVCQELCKISG